MGKNGYLAKQQARERAIIQMTSETYSQHAFDCCAIALRRVFGFGPERMARLGAEIERVRLEYHDALKSCHRKDPAELGRIDELRIRMDRELEAAWGPLFVPFEVRQDNIPPL